MQPSSSRKRFVITPRYSRFDTLPRLRRGPVASQRIFLGVVQYDDARHVHETVFNNTRDQQALDGTLQREAGRRKIKPTLRCGESRQNELNSYAVLRIPGNLFPHAFTTCLRHHPSPQLP